MEREVVIRMNESDARLLVQICSMFTEKRIGISSVGLLAGRIMENIENALDVPPVVNVDLR